MNQFLLQLLARSVSPDLRGRRLEAVRFLPPILAIEFAGGEPARFGVVVLSAPGPFCYFDSVDPTAGLGTRVLRRVSGLAVKDIIVAECERILRIELGHREPLALSLYLFGSASKIRVESERTIVESLNPAECGQELPARRPPRGVSLANASTEELSRLLRSTETPERTACGLTREVLDCFTRADGDVDVESLAAFRDAVASGRVAFMLGTRKGGGSVCPLPQRAAGDPVGTGMAVLSGPFQEAREACRSVGTSIVSDLREEIIARSAAPLEKYLASRRRLLEALELDRKSAEAYAALRNEANTLAAYQARIPPGSSMVRLPNPYGGDETTIELDPAVPLREQIKKKFRRAAKLERGRATLEKRVRSVAEQVARVEGDLDAARRESSLRDAVRRIERAMARLGLEAGPRQAKRAKPETRQLRRFDLDDHWFVLVGRSDRENDEITFAIASPDDFWFHAQQVAGSHVVLKCRGTPGNPPDSILEAAAGIAAHFSKARRASVVPVIYTRRKYVRKFRGSRPGQVICEREKTIFAEPRTPAAAGE
jgi:predicted ribosome quality control (RQC) complex YloA/Tae2 family protein